MSGWSVFGWCAVVAMSGSLFFTGAGFMVLRDQPARGGFDMLSAVVMFVVGFRFLRAAVR